MQEFDISEIKDKLKDFLKNKNIKNSIRFIKKYFPYEKIFQHVEKIYNFSPRTTSETVYLFLHDEKNFLCKHGKIKKFNSYYRGYFDFCKRNKDCFCLQERKKEATKNYKKNLSEEKKLEIEEKKKRTNLEKYGVYNISELETIKNKKKQTFMKKYGVDCNLKLFSVREKIRKTNIEKFGYSSPAKNEKIKQKIKETNLKRYGTDNPVKNHEIKSKIKKTNIERYGSETPLKNEKIKQKIKETNMKKYGSVHPLKNPEIKQKLENTNIEKFGFYFPMKNNDIKNKAKETNLEKYGYNVPSKNELIKQKIVETNLRRFGVTSPLKCEEIKNKIRKTNFLKYGTEIASKSEQVKQKAKETNLKKYGVENFNYLRFSKEVVEKLKDVDWLKHQHYDLKKPCYQISKELGVSETVVGKIFQRNGIEVKLFNESHEEKELKEYLNEIGFHFESRNRKLIYPYEIDIFIPEKNIAIEYCGLFWHSERQKQKEYHRKKLEKCIQKKLKLITLFSNEWMHDRERTKQKLIWILEGNEYKIHEEEIGKEEILVDRRWTEGTFLLDFGYELIETLPEKRWGITKNENIYEINDDIEFKNFIWDCGWHRYKKI
ncbi:MAG: hypothetical protein NZZ41_05435 [Candidatus Dojkabacteria bacterium]|nr:hypothetical protein [Candidatus Dojkabacteria bacterium]